MSYISLYRKYRPKTFSDLVGQEIVKTILKNSIINNKINHAFIFSGPRGTGKTSVAKIYAKAINCLNNNDGDLCNKCVVCKTKTEEEIDIIEIDAASNNGVDEIREIRNNAKLSPNNLKYKVYIIDEVHMLSTSAFNALLKTLEEPPSNVIFILATTEFNKIPETVVSRCQKLEFKKLTNNQIFERLKYICKEEKIKISDKILNVIAKKSQGGLRDAINYTDQLNSLSQSEITFELATDFLDIIDESIIENTIISIMKNDIKSILEILNDIYEKNIDYNSYINLLQNLIKNIIIYRSNENYFEEEYSNKLSNIDIELDKLFEINDELFKLQNSLKKSTNQKELIEVTFLKIILLNNKNNKKDLTVIDDSKQETSNMNEKETIISSIKEENILEEENEIKKILINNAFSRATKDYKQMFAEKYINIENYFSNKDYNNISNLMKEANIEVVSDKNIIFSFKNKFQVVLFEKNKDLVIKLLKEIYNTKYSIVAITTKEWEKYKEEYIQNCKKGIKYVYSNEKDLNKKNKKSTKLENTIENLFGDEFISK